MKIKQSITRSQRRLGLTCGWRDLLPGEVGRENFSNDGKEYWLLMKNGTTMEQIVGKDNTSQLYKKGVSYRWVNCPSNPKVVIVAINQPTPELYKKYTP